MNFVLSRDGLRLFVFELVLDTEKQMTVTNLAMYLKTYRLRLFVPFYIPNTTHGQWTCLDATSDTYTYSKKCCLLEYRKPVALNVWR